MFLLAQRAILALYLLLLISCSAQIRQWEIQEIVTKKTCFNGGRLLLGPDTDYSHLELEIMRNRSGIYFYINLLFLQAPPLQDDPTRTRLEILFEEQEPWITYPYLLEGGQKLLLSGDVAENLIKALLEDQFFSMRIGRSKITVPSTNFSTVYEELLAIPITEIGSFPEK